MAQKHFAEYACAALAAAGVGCGEGAAFDAGLQPAPARALRLAADALCARALAPEDLRRAKVGGSSAAVGNSALHVWRALYELTHAVIAERCCVDGCGAAPGVAPPHGRLRPLPPRARRQRAGAFAAAWGAALASACGEEECVAAAAAAAARGGGATARGGGGAAADAAAALLLARRALSAVLRRCMRACLHQLRAWGLSADSAVMALDAATAAEAVTEAALTAGGSAANGDAAKGADALVALGWLMARADVRFAPADGGGGGGDGGGAALACDLLLPRGVRGTAATAAAGGAEAAEAEEAEVAGTDGAAARAAAERVLAAAAQAAQRRRRLAARVDGAAADGTAAGAALRHARSQCSSLGMAHGGLSLRLRALSAQAAAVARLRGATEQQRRAIRDACAGDAGAADVAGAAAARAAAKLSGHELALLFRGAEGGTGGGGGGGGLHRAADGLERWLAPEQAAARADAVRAEASFWGWLASLAAAVDRRGHAARCAGGRAGAPAAPLAAPVAAAFAQRAELFGQLQRQWAAVKPARPGAAAATKLQAMAARVDAELAELEACTRAATASGGGAGAGSAGAERARPAPAPAPPPAPAPGASREALRLLREQNAQVLVQCFRAMEARGVPFHRVERLVRNGR